MDLNILAQNQSDQNERSQYVRQYLPVSTVEM